MSQVITGEFARLAPVMKARTLVCRRVEGKLPMPRGCSAANVESIADTLTLGWLDEQLRIQREGLAHLRQADGALDEAIATAHTLCREHEVPRRDALLFFTLLEGVRADVRAALQQLALCGLILSLTLASFAKTGDDDLARRGARSRSRRRDDEVALVDGETGGVL